MMKKNNTFKAGLLVIAGLFTMTAAAKSLIPIEIDLSRKNPQFPFKTDLPIIVTDIDQIQLNYPVSVTLNDDTVIVGMVKFLSGGWSTFIGSIHVEDESTGIKHKLKIEDFKSIAFSMDKKINVTEVASYQEGVDVLNKRADDFKSKATGTPIEAAKEIQERLELMKGQKVAYFERVNIIDGKKTKTNILQVINVNPLERTKVTLYVDPKAKVSQVGVSLLIKEEGYYFKGKVFDKAPQSYYVRKNDSDETYLMNKKMYKKSKGGYPEEIFTCTDLIEQLNQGNEASVNKYDARNWAFFYPTMIAYNTHSC